MKIVVIYPKYIISSFVASGSGMMKLDNKNRSQKKLSKPEIRPAQKNPDPEKLMCATSELIEADLMFS